jgi:hypothetical protein
MMKNPGLFNEFIRVHMMAVNDDIHTAENIYQQRHSSSRRYVAKAGALDQSGG